MKGILWRKGIAQVMAIVLVITSCFAMTPAASADPSEPLPTALNGKSAANLALPADGVTVTPIYQTAHQGASSLGIINDGLLNQTIDSWNGTQQTSDHWGYTWSANYNLNEVHYTTGTMFADGGWFTNIKVQVLQDGSWIDVSNTVVSPAYPNNNTAGTNKTYGFRFDDTWGNGVRIIGAPGGGAKFTSISELAVYYTDGNEIVSLSVPGQSAPATVTSAVYNVTFHMPHGTNVSALAPTITVSPGASISPASASTQDFTSPVTYTVTSRDGVSQAWTVTCVVDSISDAKDITKFAINGQIAVTKIDKLDHTVTIRMPAETSLENIVPKAIGVSPLASISPSPAEAQDFRTPVTYTVTAQDGSTQNWTVQAMVTPDVNAPESSFFSTVTMETYTTYSTASDGDLWPAAWSDDGLLYTANGDGKGFGNEFSDIAVSVVTSGDPYNKNITGNILTTNVSQVWSGPGYNRKPTGMISIDGVLYLAVQDLSVGSTAFDDAPAATIAKSTDKGQTWTWDKTAPMFSDNTFTTIMFLDAGQDYVNNTDGYVYAYGLDGNWRDSFNNTAIDPTGLYLARVPEDSIMDRSKWEFYTGQDSNGATWSYEIGKREPVLQEDRRIYTNLLSTVDKNFVQQKNMTVLSQGSITYNKPLNRYLYFSWTEYTFEFYESPTPWGPWKRFYTEDVGVYPWTATKNGGYSTTAPSKYISDDGKTLWIQSNTFMGAATNYNFNFRKLELEPYTNTTEANPTMSADNLALPAHAEGVVQLGRSFHNARNHFLNDGITLQSEDSWNGEAKPTDYWGYTWPRQYNMNTVVYTTGNIYGDGGWFNDLKVQVRQRVGDDYQWIDVTGLAATPEYPGNNTAGSNQTYTFTFDPISGDGVRLIGAPGGTSKFTSVGELEVYYRDNTIKSSAKNIVSFSVPGQNGPSTIDPAARTVTFLMPSGTNVTALIPAIGVSTYATISPESSTAQNFTNPVTYTVTAEDGSTQQWTVTCVLPGPAVNGFSDDNLALPAHGEGVTPAYRAVQFGHSSYMNDGNLLNSETSWTAVKAESDWWGYTWYKNYNMNKVVYTTGNMFPDGGWFNNIRVQVRKNGAWTDVTGLTAAPAYPNNNTAGPNKTYVFTFNGTSGDGVRIVGAPGGSAKFTTIGELEVYYSSEGPGPTVAMDVQWAANPGTSGFKETMNAEVLQVTLDQASYVQANVNQITLSGTAVTEAHVSIESVTYVDPTHVNIALAWDGTDFDAKHTLTVNIPPSAYTDSSGGVTLTGSVTVDAGNETVKVARVTGATQPGEKLPNPNQTVATAKVGGTDLGIMWDMGNGKTMIAFGDTYGVGWTGPGAGGPDWRSNWIAISDDHNLTDGLTFSSVITDTTNHAKEIIPSAHDTSGNGDWTTIPTAGVTVGTRHYIHFMDVKSWTGWTTNYSELAYSDDDGQTWTTSGVTWSGDSKFAQAAYVKKDGYVYMFGTPSGRYGGAYLARVPEANLLDKTSYEYWNGSSWIANDESAAIAIVQAPVAELSVIYSTYYNEFMMSYLNENRAAMVIRTASDLTGPWSDEKIVAKAQQYPALYGGFIHPDSADSKYLYMTMSQWNPYNVYLIRTNPATLELAGPLNYVADGGFENQSSGAVSFPWVLEGKGGIDYNNGFARSGKNSAYLRFNSGWNGLRQQITLLPNTDYTLSMYVRTGKDNVRFGTGYYGIRKGDGATVLAESTFNRSDDTEHTLVTLDFNSGDQTTAYVFVGSWMNNGDAWLQIDDVSIQAKPNHPPVFDPIEDRTVNTAQSVTFSVYATDADGDALTYSALSLPNGATFNVGTRTFDWTPSASQAGSYQVTFNVSDGKAMVSKNVTITVNAVQQEEGGNTPTPTPDNNEKPSTPTEKPIVEVINNTAVVTLNQDQTTADIPVEQIADHPLQVTAGKVTLSVDRQVIDKLKAQSGDLNGATLVVKVEPVTNAGTQANLQAAGQIYDINVILRQTDGTEFKAEQVDGGVRIMLPVEDDNADQELLGVYYYNESTKQWEYVGGTFDPTENAMTIELQHLSTYAVMEYNKSYLDVPASHWAYRTIKVLSAKHIVNGMSENEFQPNAKTTRAEFTALLVRALGLTASANPAPFADIHTGDWYADEVAAAYAAGLIQGVSANEFSPNAQITREEMAALLVRAFEYRQGSAITADHALQGYKDEATVSKWAKAEVNKAIAAGLMNGKGGNLFDPSSDAVRAETAQAILNLLSK